MPDVKATSTAGVEAQGHRAGDYNTATSNPIAHNYTVTCRWSEYTRP